MARLRVGAVSGAANLPVGVGMLVEFENRSGAGAIRYGRACVRREAQPLLAGGAKLDGPPPQNLTPLSMALITKQDEAARELIAAGALITLDAAAKLTHGGPDPQLTDLAAQGTAP